MRPKGSPEKTGQTVVDGLSANANSGSAMQSASWPVQHQTTGSSNTSADMLHALAASEASSRQQQQALHQLAGLQQASALHQNRTLQSGEISSGRALRQDNSQTRQLQLALQELQQGNLPRDLQRIVPSHISNDLGQERLLLENLRQQQQNDLLLQRVMAQQQQRDWETTSAALSRLARGRNESTGLDRRQLEALLPGNQGETSGAGSLLSNLNGQLPGNASSSLRHNNPASPQSVSIRNSELLNTLLLQELRRREEQSNQPGNGVRSPQFEPFG